MAHDPESSTGVTVADLLRDPASREAWERFEKRYRPKIFGWCRHWRLQEADAEDVTQTVLTKLLEKIKTYDPRKGRFRAWLKTVAHNAWLDYVNGQGRAVRASGDSDVWEQLQSVEARDDLLKRLEDEFDLELLEEAVARVKVGCLPREWEIYRAMAIDERTGADVAAELGMTVQAVFQAKYRVQKAVRAAVQQLEGADSEQGEDET